MMRRKLMVSDMRFMKYWLRMTKNFSNVAFSSSSWSSSLSLSDPPLSLSKTRDLI